MWLFVIVIDLVIVIVGPDFLIGLHSILCALPPWSILLWLLLSYKRDLRLLRRRRQWRWDLRLLKRRKRGWEDRLLSQDLKRSLCIGIHGCVLLRKLLLPRC